MDLKGEKMRSEKINSLVQQLVGEVQNSNQGITAPRPPEEGRKKDYEKYLEKIGQVRGRALYYPYVGSGAGRGAYVELEDGSVKLDLINGIGVHLFGHAHPRLMAAAVRGALSDVTNQGNLQPNIEYTKLAEKLVGLAGANSRLKHVWITTCGSRANEIALKITRQKHSPARMVIAMERAFAGRTTMMAEITDNPEYRQGLPSYNEVLRVPFYDAKDPRSSEKALKIFKEHVDKHEKNIAAFMFELVQGEGGFRTAPREFFLPMFEVCKEKNISIWADEVQTFTRTGQLFAFETMNLGKYIDVCTVAKTLQVAATLYTEDLNPKPGLVAGTFSGSSAALSVGNEVLEILTTENIFGSDGKVNQLHKKFVAMLENLSRTSCKGSLADPGGIGLMVAVTPLDGSKDKVQKLLKILFNNGLLCFSCGRDPYRVRFLLPLVLEDRDIEVAGKIIEKSILEAAKG